MHATTEYAEITRLEALGLANAGIVHDINNQLMLILGHLENGNLSAARYSAKNCAIFTSSLIDFAKDRSAPPLRALDLAGVVTANVVSLNIPDNISLCLELCPNSTPILGDFTGITRMLHNLVSNAVSAIRKNKNGRGTITISAIGHELTVTDNGPGLTAAQIRALTGPFRGLHAAFDNGLGLAIVQELANQNRALMRTWRTASKGTTFSLLFQGAPAGENE